MVRSIQYFKDKFVPHYPITQEDYGDWLDSFRHITSAVPLGDTTGLDAILANYRLKNVNIPVSEIDGLGPYLTNILSSYLTNGSAIAISQVTNLQNILNGFTSVTQVQNMITTALDNYQPDNVPYIGTNGNWWIGNPNATPPTGTDTGVKAAGEDGQDGEDGQGIFIGPNGNWWLGDPVAETGTDTGYSAQGGAHNFELLYQHPAVDVFNFALKYDNAQGNTVYTLFNMRPAFDNYLEYAMQTDNGAAITGAIDGVNRDFYPSLPFRRANMMVFRDGLKMRLGSDKDYVFALDANNVDHIKFNFNVPVDSSLEFVYFKATF